MRYLFLLIVVAIVYLAFFRSSPAKQIVEAAVQPQVMTNGLPPAGSNFVKRPLDRTHAVLDQVAEKTAADRF